MPASKELIENGKRQAAYCAVDENISVNYQVIGIGSGSTVVFVVERILQKPELHHIVYVPTSFQSLQLITENGLKLGSVEQYDKIDVTNDGADEVDNDLNAIKGGDACQFQKKVVAEAAEKFILVADLRKESSKLGTQWIKSVPIEIIPIMAVNKAGPVVTDNDNFVVDAHFGEINDPASLLKEFKFLTGVMKWASFVT